MEEKNMEQELQALNDKVDRLTDNLIKMQRDINGILNLIGSLSTLVTINTCSSMQNYYNSGYNAATLDYRSSVQNQNYTNNEGGELR